MYDFLYLTKSRKNILKKKRTINKTIPVSINIWIAAVKSMFTFSVEAKKQKWNTMRCLSYHTSFAQAHNINLEDQRKQDDFSFGIQAKAPGCPSLSEDNSLTLKTQAI